LSFTTTPGTVSNPTMDRIYIGAEVLGGTERYYYSGFMFQILLWSRSLSLVEQQAVELYLKNKWGI